MPLNSILPSCFLSSMAAAEITDRRHERGKEITQVQENFESTPLTGIEYMDEHHDDPGTEVENSSPLPQGGGFIEIALPALILALGVFLRIYCLGSHSLWADEAFTVFVSRLDIPSLMQFLAHHDAHPPLFYLITHAVLKLSGGEFMLRLPSALSGMMILLVTYLFTLHTWGRKTALTTLFLLSISASQVYSTQEIRMYPLFSLLALSATYLLYLSTGEGKKWHLPLYFISVILMLYTHYLSLVVLAAHGSALPFLTRNRKTLISVYGFMALSLLCFLPGLGPACFLALCERDIASCPIRTVHVADLDQRRDDAINVVDGNRYSVGRCLPLANAFDEGVSAKPRNAVLGQPATAHADLDFADSVVERSDGLPVKCAFRFHG